MRALRPQREHVWGEEKEQLGIDVWATAVQCGTRQVASIFGTRAATCTEMAEEEVERSHERRRRGEEGEKHEEVGGEKGEENKEVEQHGLTGAHQAAPPGAPGGRRAQGY